MKVITYAAIIAVGAGVGAVAQDQLYLSAGVASGAMSVEQVIQLQAAREDGDWGTVRQIERNAGGTVMSTQSVSSTRQGSEQLEMSLGLSPGELTVPQMIQLRSAREDGDHQAERFIMSGTAAIVSTQSVGRAPASGVSQLAAHLHVDSADYTLSELAAMHLDD